MAEEIEPITGKKRRIIHWNPDAGKEPVRRRWSWGRVVLWTVGGFFGLLFAAGGVIRLIKMVKPEAFQAQAPAAAEAGNVDPNAAFVSETKAEFTHENTGKALAELRRLPMTNPRQVEKFVLLEKDFLIAESVLASHDYAQAFASFEALNRRIEEFSLSIKMRDEAQVAYDTILLKIKALEIARSLAPDALEAATTSASAARQFLSDGDFLSAKKVLDEGFAQLNKAQKAIDDYVAGNIWRGQQALVSGEREAASSAFNAALEKSPGNEAALQGLKRAETIDRVHALLAQAGDLEKKAEYAQAAEAYQKAFALDAFSAAAQEGQSRASRLEIETRFNTAYAAAEAAFKAKEWDKVIAEGEKALKVYPQRTEVQQMIKSARENAHVDAVQNALKKAYAYENQHQWLEARDAYNETLRLEPNLADAKEGYARTGTMIRALLQYNTLIEATEKLVAHNDFQGGIHRFNDAMAVKPAYLVNNDRVQQLHATLMAQSKEVSVVFHSDGKTWVSIGILRMLGQIDTTKVAILPGDYEIVGRRKGYKDVHLLLQVRNGTPPPTVNVICQFLSEKS
jgi:tetratricopeptide (TPR) repeat protein